MPGREPASEPAPTRPRGPLGTVAGSVVVSVGLILANHGLPWPAAVPIVLVGIFFEAGFTPAAIAHLADVSADFVADRGLIMGVYSVVLGLGHLIGNVLGGVFVARLRRPGAAHHPAGRGRHHLGGGADGARPSRR